MAKIWNGQYKPDQRSQADLSHIALGVLWPRVKCEV